MAKRRPAPGPLSGFVEAGIEAAAAKGAHATAERLGIRAGERIIEGAEGAAIQKAVAKASTKQASRLNPNLPGGTQIVWNGDKLTKILHGELAERVKKCTQLVKDQTKKNLSLPVLKYTNPRTGHVTVLPESRSKPGEFPRTEHGGSGLMGNIFGEMIEETKGAVGTTLGYGLLLETKMDRSFLRRTLNEMQPLLKQILVKTVDL